MSEDNNQELPNSAEAWYEKGIDYLKEKNFYKARDCFKKVIEINPKYEKAWFQLGFAHGNLYNPDEALKCYRRAVEQDPNDYEAWYDMGNEYLHYGENPMFDDPWEEDSGMYEPAIECYEKAIKSNSEFSYAWNNMGFAYGKLGQHQKAAEYHQKAYELDEENQNALVNWGCALYFLKEYDKAMEIYEKAVERDPNDNNARLVLRTSLESYKTRNKLTSENKEMWLRIARNHIKLNELKLATDCLKQILALDKEFYEAWHELGKIYMFLKDHEKFMKCFTPFDKNDKELKKISIITTSEGPLYPDVFWLIETSSDIIIVPSEGPAENFLSYVQDIPDFSNEQVIEAMKSTEDKIFTCWEKK